MPQNLYKTSKPDQVGHHLINHMQPRMMVMKCRESEFISIYSYAVLSAVIVEYIFIWTSFPLSLSVSVISCALHRSVPVKIFCLKQRARDGGPKFTPSECINVFVKKQGAAGLKLSRPHRNVQRGAERREVENRWCFTRIQKQSRRTVLPR